MKSVNSTRNRLIFAVALTLLTPSCAKVSVSEITPDTNKEGSPPSLSVSGIRTRPEFMGQKVLLRGFAGYNIEGKNVPFWLSASASSYQSAPREIVKLITESARQSVALKRLGGSTYNGGGATVYARYLRRNPENGVPVLEVLQFWGALSNGASTRGLLLPALPGDPTLHRLVADDGEIFHVQAESNRQLPNLISNERKHVTLTGVIAQPTGENHRIFLAVDATAVDTVGFTAKISRTDQDGVYSAKLLYRDQSLRVVPATSSLRTGLEQAVGDYRNLTLRRSPERNSLWIAEGQSMPDFLRVLRITYGAYEAWLGPWVRTGLQFLALESVAPLDKLAKTLAFTHVGMASTLKQDLAIADTQSLQTLDLGQASGQPCVVASGFQSTHLNRPASPEAACLTSSSNSEEFEGYISETIAHPNQRVLVSRGEFYQVVLPKEEKLPAFSWVTVTGKALELPRSGIKMIIASQIQSHLPLLMGKVLAETSSAQGGATHYLQHSDLNLEGKAPVRIKSQSDDLTRWEGTYVAARVSGVDWAGRTSTVGQVVPLGVRQGLKGLLRYRTEPSPSGAQTFLFSPEGSTEEIVVVPSGFPTLAKMLGMADPEGTPVFVSGYLVPANPRGGKALLMTPFDVVVKQSTYTAETRTETWANANCWNAPDSIRSDESRGYYGLSDVTVIDASPYHRARFVSLDSAARTALSEFCERSRFTFRATFFLAGPHMIDRPTPTDTFYATVVNELRWLESVTQ